MKATINLNVVIDESSIIHLYSSETPEVEIMNKEGAIIRISAKVEAIEKIDELITSLSLIKGEIAKNTFIKLSTQIK